MVALRAYLDSSGKLEDDWITLAAVAGTDDMWAEFETEWDKILAEHTPKGDYIHMREVFRLIKGFDSNKGWDHQKAFGLVNKCLVYMSHLDKKRFRMFYCSVNLNAWRKLRAETYQMPDPVEMCNKFCAETILGWYLLHYPDAIDVQNDRVKYFFDHNEDFFQSFHEKWKREKQLVVSDLAPDDYEKAVEFSKRFPDNSISDAISRWSIWSIIDQVCTVDMKTTPGVQAADIIAWGRNRETFAQEGDIGSHLAHILRTVLPSYSVVWDENKLREQYRPLIHL